jgi:hypothetical protein
VSAPPAFLYHPGKGQRSRWQSASCAAAVSTGWKMSRLARLLAAIAAVGLAQSAARAEDHTCKFAELSFSYFRVVQQGETSTYLLTTSGPKWRNVPYGRHAPGYLHCENCPGRASGLYHFLDQANLDKNTSVKLPATAAERAEQRQEWFGYPPLRLGPQDLEHFGSREGIVLGPLRGYAVLYRFASREQGSKAWIDLLEWRAGGLLVIAVTDGCVWFETAILSKAIDDGDPWVLLDSVLREVTIEKLPGAPAGPVPRGAYGATMMPPH